MAVSATARILAALTGMVAVLAAAPPAHADRAPQARLVHCGPDTCLRISGHRPRAAVTVRIAGQDLAVAGRRDWAVTLPLATARAWAEGPGGTLMLDYVDRQGAMDNTQVVPPPGALGRPVALASLVIRAR